MYYTETFRITSPPGLKYGNHSRKQPANLWPWPPPGTRCVGVRRIFTTPYFLTKVSYRPLSLLALPRGLAYLSFACV